eukprot:3202837-Heterocapsa_arctica.AAC.1
MHARVRTEARMCLRAHALKECRSVVPAHASGIRVASPVWPWRGLASPAGCLAEPGLASLAGRPAGWRDHPGIVEAQWDTLW